MNNMQVEIAFTHTCNHDFLQDWCRSRKVYQGVGGQLFLDFVALGIIFYKGENSKRAIIAPPAKRHLNGVSLLGRLWHDFPGEGGRDPQSVSGSALDLVIKAYT